MTKIEARFDRMVESFLRYNDPHEPWPMILVKFAAHVEAVFPAMANSNNEADIAFRDFLRAKLENLRAF